MKEHKKRLEERRKKLKKEREIIEDLKVLKEKRSEEFLRRFNKYKIEDPEFYQKILENIKVKEATDEPVDVMQSRGGSGHKNIKIEEKESESHESKIWNLNLILAIIGFTILLVIIIIIFFLI